jgi:N-acylneuraminate cytidylyltransferase
MDRVVNRLEVLGVVMARGGSKGLTRKNVRPLRGHPLVAYSIASGLAAETITRVIMSTDDREIADTARAYGADVPFLRPAELALDDTPDFPVIEHALRWLAESEGYRPEVVVQLRPTTPFRPRGFVDEAVRLLLEDSTIDCVRGVTIPKQTPFKMWRPREDGTMGPLLELPDIAEPYNAPRQKLPVAYWQTGHVDAIRTRTILEQRTLTGRRVRPLLIEQHYCVDIDTAADFELAEQALEAKSLDIDFPRSTRGDRQGPREWPRDVRLVVFDFDGVFTDNRVLTLQDGTEGVLCDRSDGLGLAMLRQRGQSMVVLSTEMNPVVSARCRKLGLPYEQGLSDKGAALVKLAESRGVSLDQIIYVGNDLNDLDCMRKAGFAVAVGDAHPSALAAADWILRRPGGQGAVREFCDLLLAHQTAEDLR